MSGETPEVRGMEAAEFEAMAAVEDRHWWFRGKRAIVTELLREAGVHGRVLDAGCGTGGNLPALMRFGEAVGVEKDPVALEFARKKSGGLVVEGEITALPFWDNEFDGIVTTDVMEHVADDRKALAELYRVLKPGGTLVLTVPAHPFMWTGHDVVLGHVRRYTMDSFRELLASAPDLETETVSYMNCAAFVPAALQRWRRARREKRAGAPDLSSDTADVPPAFANEMAYRIFAAERKLLPGISLPFGVSIVAVLRKRGSEASSARLTGAPVSWGWLLAIVALLLACSSQLTGQWLAGHEGPAYLFRASEFFSLLSQGELYPRWCADFYWGYGYPFFVFYSPGLFYTSSVFRFFGLPVDTSVSLAACVSNLLLFMGSYRLAGLYTRQRSVAFAASLFSLLAFYRFVQVHVRTDYAEAFATALVPWVLAEAVILSRSMERKALVRLALMHALVFFSHTITAVMTSAALGLIGLSMLVRGDARAFARVAAGSLLAVMVASVYWLPAFVEQKYVQTEKLVEKSDDVNYHYADHFVYPEQRVRMEFYYGDSRAGQDDRLSFASSWVFWVIAGCAAFLAASRPAWRRKNGGILLGWILTNLMMMPAAGVLWDHLPMIPYFQFPWRFLLLDLVVAAPLAAAVLDELILRKPSKPELGILAVLAAGLCSLQFRLIIRDTFWEAISGGHPNAAAAWWGMPLILAFAVVLAVVVFLASSQLLHAYVRLAVASLILCMLPVSLSAMLRGLYSPMKIDADLRRAIDQPLFMQKYGLVLPGGKVIPVSTAAQDEYLPKTARVDSQKPPESPVRILSGSGRAKVVDQWGDRRTYEVEMDTPGTVEAAYFYYPGVQVDVDGSAREPGLSLNGLVTVTLDPGRYRVDVFYDASPLQKKAALLSLLGVIICALLYVSPAFKRRLEAGERAGG